LKFLALTLIKVFILTFLIVTSAAFIVEHTILPAFPLLPNYTIKEITLTAYSPSKAQTSGNPFETASTLIVTPNDLWQLKYVAISRDLKEKYDLKWGDKIYLEFEIQDLMGKTAQGVLIENSMDMFVRNEIIAMEIGNQRRRVIIIKK